MNDEVKKATESLKEKIFSLPETQEFLRLKDLIQKDKNLKAMRIEIAKLDGQKKIKERDNLLEEYNSIPLIANYNSVKSDLYDTLNEVYQILK